MTKVLISDKMSPLAAKVFAARGIEVDVKPGMTPEELLACIGDYDGLAVRSATKATTAVLEAGVNLKVVGRAGIGVDNVDIPCATQRGVVVMNTPFGNSITTAEHAIALLMSLARHIPLANESTHAGKWEKSRFMGMELMGKTLGIIGCGNIGSVVADRAQGLKMKVIASDPYLSVDRAEALGVEKVDLDELYARADFISLHTPITDATRTMINAEAIAKMKPGMRIINCARGGLVVEEDLKAALESGHLAAAALDVYPTEPAKENILFGMENVIATPHLGASTTEAQEKVAEQVAEQMADYLLTGAVTNALNMASVSAEDAPKLRPYMKLAEYLGSFAGQLADKVFNSITVEYEGQAANLNTKPLTAIVLQGLLAPTMESVNMVSAPVIAKERDIDVSEVTHERTGAYSTMIKVTLGFEDGEFAIAGTLFNGEKPRIIRIRDIPIDAKVGPHMLYITNLDQPGFVGALGMVLGEAKLNIANFTLGRSEAGGDAIVLIEIDDPATDQVLETVRALPHVVKANALAF
jgi:D-3-phosphoglycerate dehydrogenase / 2-oxoglutarate reductase